MAHFFEGTEKNQQKHYHNLTVVRKNKCYKTCNSKIIPLTYPVGSLSWPVGLGSPPPVVVSSPQVEPIGSVPRTGYFPGPPCPFAVPRSALPAADSRVQWP